MSKHMRESMSQMQNTIYSFHVEMSKLDTACADLLNAVYSLKSGFQSPFFQAYYDKLAELHEVFQQSRKKMDDFADRLNANLQLYLQAEHYGAQAPDNSPDTGPGGPA